MKQLFLLLLLAAVTGPSAFAQQKRDTHYLLIAVEDVSRGLGGIEETTLVTREDGTQEQIDGHRGISYFGLGKIKPREDSLMAMLKFYFDQGWRLVSVTSFKPVEAVEGNITRYFLSKKDE